MKKILFVINTMVCAGAEKSLLQLLKKMTGEEYEISLYVLMGQGELISEVPDCVKIMNRTFHSQPVSSRKGKRELVRTVVRAFFRNGKYIRKLRYIVRIFIGMVKIRRIQLDKLLWRVVSEGAERFDEKYDMAVAWLEGGSAYYVADYVKSKKKVAFIHIDYAKAGYTREMDQNCWKDFDKIFIVSKDAENNFCEVYPEYRDRTAVFPNIIDQDYIRRQSREPGGFSDDYEGTRILTVGRLVYQKGYDIAIDAMSLLKKSGYNVRWYVLGEGDQREKLHRKIKSLGLEKDFLLLGAVENPYPYFAQADLYVHAVRYEGQGIVVLEAQTLGCAVIVSDYCSSREQIEDGKYGIACALNPRAVADSIISLLNDEDRRLELGRMAATKKVTEGQEEMFLKLIG